MTLELHVRFDRDEPVYRYVWRARKRNQTRRRMRLAARRSGTADSIKKLWREYIASPQIVGHFSYEFFCLMLWQGRGVNGLAWVREHWRDGFFSTTLTTERILPPSTAG